MSNLILDNIALRLSRSLEKKVLDFAVLHGYAVDRAAYLNDPVGYAAKQVDIKNRKGFCVEIFGHGSSHDRDVKAIPRIVITAGGFSGGSLGNDLIGYTEENDEGGYSKYMGPVRSANWTFDVELVSNKAMQDVVLEAIRNATLSNFAFIPLYDAAQDTFLIQYGPNRNVPDLGVGLIQRVYSYSVLDIFETLPALISTEVARIKQIKVTDPDDSSPRMQLPGKNLITIDRTDITIDQTDITIDQTHEI